MKTIIKMRGLGVTMRILVGVGFTIGALALTKSQVHVKSLFAVIAKNKDKQFFFLLVCMTYFTFYVLHYHLPHSISPLKC